MKKLFLAMLICCGLFMVNQEIHLDSIIASFTAQAVETQATVVVGQDQAIDFETIEFDQAIEAEQLLTDLSEISTAQLGRSTQKLTYLDQSGQRQTLNLAVWVLQPINLEDLYGLENQINDYMASFEDQPLILNFEGWLDQERLNQLVNQQMKAGTYLSAITFRIDHQLNYTYYPDGRVDVTLEIDKYNHHNWQEEQAVNQYVQDVIDQLSLSRDQFTDEEMVRQVHDYIIHRAAYATPNDSEYLVGGSSSADVDTIAGISIHSPYAIIQEGRGVCQAYAALFQKFCDYLEIPCVFVLGQRDNDGLETHAWNKVMIDGQWYNIDLTWDDPIIGQESNDLISGGERDQYYLKSDATFQVDHQFETGLEFPSPADYEQY